ncbi:hypothetical protein BZG36_05637 [Bifiguratus adelaidae]|uniref:Uncharacterized protein n=1 Tax=Bifiguratus adelaidae TaxID=1938954 RepID=A0A261XSY2_9FUNG|nr:hypothetical protein BZG36_05637 [Bifiguratus adelaidae]
MSSFSGIERSAPLDGEITKDKSVQLEAWDTESRDTNSTDPRTLQPNLRPATACYLPQDLAIPPSEDGSYTPPPPDTSLVHFLRQVSDEDWLEYCTQWHRRQTTPPEEYEYNRHGECGTWQEDYIQLHNKGIATLQLLKSGTSIAEDGNPVKYVSYVCNDVSRSFKACGGLADRMCGMISTFFFALLTGRTYLAYWHETNPHPLEYIFEHPYVDWRFDPKAMRNIFVDISTEASLALDSVDQESMRVVNVVDRVRHEIDQTYFPDGAMQDFDNLWNESYLEISSNRAFIVRTFQLSKRYPSILQAMGLLKGNAFGCITDFLFRSTVGARRFIDAYKDVFALDSVFSIGIQIRTGDAGLVNPTLDTPTIDSYSYFLTCAKQLAQTYRKPQHRKVVYYLITDSKALRDGFSHLNHDPTLAKQYLAQDATILTTGLPIVHLDAKSRKVAQYINSTHPQEENTAEERISGTTSVIIENWLLSYTDYRVISYGGFGKIAAFHSSKDGTTVMIPKRINAKNKVPDCSLPNAFISYDELAGMWSLG